MIGEVLFSAHVVNSFDTQAFANDFMTYGMRSACPVAEHVGHRNGEARVDQPLRRTRRRSGVMPGISLITTMPGPEPAR